MKTTEKKRPGGKTSIRISKVITICDTSGSMTSDGKIYELNNCMKEAVPHIKKIDEENPMVEIQMSVMSFDIKPHWVIQNTPISEFVWKDLVANPDGLTNIGEALSLLAMEMENPDSMPERGFPPLIVLITDGMSTDDYLKGLKEFLDTNWGRKAIRYAIGIGKDSDSSVLTKFINNPEIKPLQVNNPEQLGAAIKLVSTVVLKRASNPVNDPSQPTVDDDISGPFPTDNDEDIW